MGKRQKKKKQNGLNLGRGKGRTSEGRGPLFGKKAGVKRGLHRKGLSAQEPSFKKGGRKKEEKSFVFIDSQERGKEILWPAASGEISFVQKTEGKLQD